MRLRPSLGLLCVVALGLITPALARPKSDVVVLTNGDRLTGEIKSMDRGKLRLKTESLATVEIEWDNIQSISSDEVFQLETNDGTNYVGTIERGTTPSTIRVVSEQSTDEIELAFIVRVRSVEKGFWKRLDGSLSSGYNYTQSSAVSTFTFDADVRSRTPRWERQASLSAYVTQQESGGTSRDDLTFQTLRLYKERWFSLFLGAFQRNDELGIDLRTLAAAGAGRHVVQTNHAELTLAGGLSANNEQVNGESGETSVEGLGMVSWSVFRYDRPETDLTMSFFAFPSITVSGRVRGEFDVTLKREIFKDFYWSLSGYESYDSKPASDEAHTNDWGVANSFGWSF